MDDMIAKTAQERRLMQIVLPAIADMGFALVRLRLRGGTAKQGQRLEIMVERPAGSIELEDCAQISIALGAILDVEDPLGDSYTLEVGSPGVDRPLTRLADFDTYQGYEAKLETRMPIDGRKRFRGILAGIEGQEVLLNISAEGESLTLGLRFDWLAEAKVVPSDDLFRALLRSHKTAGAERAEQAERAERSEHAKRGELAPQGGTAP
ncbi:MAG: ribosome maturation factor RimP [Rhodobacteraceae bacterium]|nr:ribosome maturation factor RimP [Paracoccaceae bacterium]